MDLSLHAFPHRFWSLLERYLPTHSICSLPFVTSFCLGMGTRRVCYGQVRGSRAGWPGARGFRMCRMLAKGLPSLSSLVLTWDRCGGPWA